jgi:hypothetical protein
MNVNPMFKIFLKKKSVGWLLEVGTKDELLFFLMMNLFFLNDELFKFMMNFNIYIYIYIYLFMF